MPTTLSDLQRRAEIAHDRSITVRALRDAAADAEAFSRDRSKKILPRIALRVAANWLRARAEGISANG